MAKIYKVSLYLTDYNDEYHDKEHMEVYLNEHIKKLWVGVSCLEAQESIEFEFDDELTINKVSATKEDYEVFFKKGETE